MNHEITRMLRKGYSFSSIAQTTGIDHCSVKKYASMSEAEFTGFLENKESRTRLLIDYEAFVKDRLLDTPAPCLYANCPPRYPVLAMAPITPANKMTLTILAQLFLYLKI